MWNGCHATTKHQVRREKSKFTIKSSKAYLRVKKAFSVSPEQAVAIAITKVVIPNVECIGTRLARKDAVADSQQRRSKKLKKPTMNWKSKMKWNVRHDAYFDDIKYYKYEWSLLHKNITCNANRPIVANPIQEWRL